MRSDGLTTYRYNHVDVPLLCPLVITIYVKSAARAPTLVRIRRRRGRPPQAHLSRRHTDRREQRVGSCLEESIARRIRCVVVACSQPLMFLIITFLSLPTLAVVMAMAVSKDCSFALTVSADHLVGRYDLVRHYARGDLDTGDSTRFSSQEHAEPDGGGPIHSGFPNQEPRKCRHRYLRRWTCLRDRRLGWSVSSFGFGWWTVSRF